MNDFNSLTNYGNQIPFVILTEFKVGYEVKVLNCYQGRSCGGEGPSSNQCGFRLLYYTHIIGNMGLPRYFFPSLQNVNFWHSGRMGKSSRIF